MHKFIFVFAVIAAVAVHSATIEKRAASNERPEAPWLLECDEPGVNRENCFNHDPANFENWKIYLQELKAWEKDYPAEAKAYNAEHPDEEAKNQAKLGELQKLAEIHKI